MRRTHARYRTKIGALVAFSLPHLPPIATLRRLVDISRGGLSFCYIAAAKQDLTSSEVDLFWGKGLDPVATGIPCRVVYDIGENGDGSHHARFRRCGVKFENLSREQESRIDDFIRYFTDRESLCCQA